MRISRGLKSLIVVSSVLFLLLGAGVVAKSYFLSQVKKKIQSTFRYADFHVSFFPPTLTLEDVQTISSTPIFRAKRVVIRISYMSLLSEDKPLEVYIDQPILRFSELPSSPPASSKDKKSKLLAFLPLPFAIEKGMIREGELRFLGKDMTFQLSHLKARFAQKQDSFSLQGEAKKVHFRLSSGSQELSGKMVFALEGKGKNINITKISVNGPDLILRASGELFDPQDPKLRLKTYLSVKTPLIANLFYLPFEWGGRAEGQGVLIRSKEELVFRTDLSSRDLILNRVVIGKVRGVLSLSDRTGGRVELSILKGSLPTEFIRIDFEDGKIKGNARRLHLDPILSYVQLPWPVKSPVWATFTIDQQGKLEADGEFKDESFQPVGNKYPFQGQVKFSWDGKKEASFASTELRSSFALVSLKGKVRIGENDNIEIQGEVTDLKQAREFTSLILAQRFDFPEIRGAGKAKLLILGDYYFPHVTANFSFSPGGFDKFNAQTVTGVAEIYKNDFSGRFKVTDPFMKGDITVSVNPENLKADIRLDQGNVEKILRNFDIILPLQGKSSGTFEVYQKGTNIQMKGDFSSPVLQFANQNLKNVKGQLEWNGDTLSFPILQFSLYNGMLKGAALVGFKSNEFDVDVLGEGFDLSSLYPKLEGKLNFSLKGKGFLGQNRASGNFEVRGLSLAHLQKAEARGSLGLGFSENSLQLDVNGNFYPGENNFEASLVMPLAGNPYSLNLKGSFNNLELVIPLKGVAGQANYLAEIRGSPNSPEVKGVVDFKGPLFPLPKFANELKDYSGLMLVEGNKVVIRSLQAKIGGGDVQGSGEIQLGKGGIERIDVKAEGKDMLLSPFERSRALADGTLWLVKDSSRFDLEGNFFIKRLSWRREVYERIAFSSVSPYQLSTEPSFFDDLTLNIRLRANDNAWMENSLGRINGRFDLTITGNVNAPIVSGDIEALGGEVYFQDRKFRVLKGRLSFFNPVTLNPYLDFQGETYVKDYRVSFSLSGLIDRLKPEYSSSPPLPPEDVLALLALGEAFKRTYSYDRSTELSTASFLSFQLAEQAKKRTEKLFSLDRFRIDPFIMGTSTEMTARLTVGKNISKNLSILYSTNLTTQREEIVRLEWELTDDFSLVGIRDEIGRISFDVKVRKRF